MSTDYKTSAHLPSSHRLRIPAYPLILPLKSSIVFVSLINITKRGHDLSIKTPKPAPASLEETVKEDGGRVEEITRKAREAGNLPDIEDSAPFICDIHSAQATVHGDIIRFVE